MTCRLQNNRPPEVNAASSIRGAFCVRLPEAPHGFTLLEVLVTIGLTAVLLAIFSASIVGTVFISKSSTSVQAHEFIQEEIDTLRSLEFTELLNRTDDAWLGIPFNRGNWSVQDKGADAYSGDQVMELSTSADAVHDETGLLTLPGNYREDFTFSSAINVQPDSPSGWGAGLAFRYRDAENYYRIRFSAGGMALERVYQGTVTSLGTESYSFAADGSTWYVIEVTVTGDSIIAKRNGITSISATDNYFTTGDLALISVNDGLAWFDGVSVTENTVTDTWNFDDSSDLGDIPVEWRRFSCLNLTEGSCTLTIEDYLGEADVKQLIVTVSWSESGKAKSATGQTLISN